MKAFFSYFGGKSRLVPTILPLIPPHDVYGEVFAGAAWVLFGKPESKVEAINDINRDLVTLYRVVQNHLEEFVRYFKWVLVSRDEFSRLKSVDPNTLTDIQRAARFWYLLRLGYASQIGNSHFSISSSKGPNLNLLRIEESLSEAHLRLSRVWVENRDFEAFIKKFDGEKTFFYIDPPYHHCETAYGKGIFSYDDFDRLAKTLADVKGKFMVSINDTPEMRAAFGLFRQHPVKTTYSTKAARTEAVPELLITNYPISLPTTT